MSPKIFSFKPEVEENIIITHPDLTIGLAEVSSLSREVIFKKKFGKKIEKRNEEREQIYKKKTRETKKNRE